MKEENILSNPNNAQELLSMTAGVLILLDKEGICVDIMLPKNTLWYLQKDILIGKKLFQFFPPSTFKEFYPNFKEVINNGIISTQNYELRLGETTLYFTCTMQPYNDKVLCQCRDTTKRSIEQIELAKRNKEMTIIQQISMIGTWVYNSKLNVLRYTGKFAYRKEGKVIYLYKE